MSSKIRNSLRFATIHNSLINLVLFLLALLPRAYALSRFVTADEAKWVYRSAQFLAALLCGDLAATCVNLTPAVTTTWLGSLGLAAYYALNRAAIGLPLAEWLLSLPEFRVDLPVLVAARWPLVIFTSLGVVVIYGLTRRLFNPALAFIAAVFIALDPHFVALSRVLGHDAPAAIFMSISVLLLLMALQSPNKNFLLPPRFASFILSAVAAGLAFLSKAPALFLIPFAGLIFVFNAISMVPQQRWGFFISSFLRMTLFRFLLWTVVAYLTFVAFWPAAWVDPLGRPYAVFQNAFVSATDGEEAEAEGYWLVPDLGPFYYLVNGPLKLSPLVLVGVGLTVWYKGRSLKKCLGSPARLRRVQSSRLPASASDYDELTAKNHLTLRQPPNHLILWLLVFVILFTAFMTLSDKRSPRYILPIFPPLAIIAAWGWEKLKGQVADSKIASSRVAGSKVAGSQMTNTETPANPSLPVSRRLPFLSSLLSPPLSLLLPLFLTLSALLILSPYVPYYFTYYNPLLGGAYTASRLVKMGWGEGLDRVGRFLQREHPDSRVGAAYASTIAPYFQGDIVGVTGANLDYVVLYVKQIQSSEPSPAFIRYFENIGPIFSVDLNGLHYADVYPGPALQPALALTPGLDHAILPQPISFRPLTPYGRLGEPLEVDVVWLANDLLPDTPSTVTLQPLSAFDFLGEHNDADGQPIAPRKVTILADGPGRLIRLADNLVVSRHHLDVPANLPAGRYALLVDGRPLGEIDLRNFQLPAGWGQVKGITFDDQIALAGYQFEPTDDYIQVNLAWRAAQAPSADYTVFVQLLNAETNERVAGVDAPPLQGAWPTSRWVKNEVVADEYVIAVPPGLLPGFYKVIVGLYRPDTGQRLMLADGLDHWPLPWTFIRK